MTSFDPKQMEPMEKEADSLVDKLKASSYTAMILIAAGIGALVLILALAA